MAERFKLIPAVYLLLRRGNEVLLLERANTGYMDGKYSLIAGHLDGDEVATEAIAREAAEEAGIEVNPADLRFAHVSHRLTREETGQERVDLFFQTDKWRGEVRNAEPHKSAGLKWFRVDDLPDNVVPIVARVIRDVEAGKNYSEYVNEPV